jgi:heme-degrading monooxygenase HmoA
LDSNEKIITMNQPAQTPATPYFAVIFTSIRSAADGEGYAQAADRMLELASQQPGFLGVENARSEDGLGITVSYWASEEAIGAWRRHAEHVLAQEAGRQKWYSRYTLRVCRVERAWAFEKACG